MTKQDKLISRLLNPAAILTWDELVSLLSSLGYRQQEGSGSRIKFFHGRLEARISLHKPHPGHEIKAYIRRQVLQHLRDEGLI